MIQKQFCKYNRLEERSWCATKVDFENQTIDKRVCENTDGEECTELLCDMDNDGSKLTEFGALDRYYKTTGELKYTFSEAVELCKRHGTTLGNIPEFNDELLFHFNQALLNPPTKGFWIGYKFNDDKLFPLHDGSTQYEVNNGMEYHGTIIEHNENNDCVVGRGTKNNFVGWALGRDLKPTLETASCYEKHAAICMKSCKGMTSYNSP